MSGPPRRGCPRPATLGGAVVLAWLTGAVALSLAASPVAAQTPLPPPPATLEDAVESVRTMVREGRGQEEVAGWLTRVVDQRVTNMNSLERMSLLENWVPFIGPSLGRNRTFAEWRDRNEFDYRVTAEWTWRNGLGQCSEIANLTYYILKEAGVPGNVRILTAPGHEIAVWGIQDGADPDRPLTWGPDALVLDGWLGMVLDAEFAHANPYIGNGGANVIVESTLSFDEAAIPWEISPGLRAEIDAEDYFIATAAYGTPLAAVRGRRGRAGRGLTTTALILVTVGLVILGGALLTVPDPAVPRFLGMMAGGWVLVAVTLVLSNRGGPAASPS